jgi:hypothetical protein
MVELVFFLFNRLNDDLLSLMVAVFCSIWLRRNKLVFEEHLSSPLTVFNDASRHYENFRLVHLKEKMERKLKTNTFNSSKLWKSPVLGCVKVKWDASLNYRDGVIGLGCVIRNDEGLIVGAKCCACKVEADPLLAEAMAAHLALNFCKEMGFSKIVCEGDSLQVVKGICDPGSHYVRIGQFVDAIGKDASGFLFCSWIHCCREANGVAHVLAREASSKYLSNRWIDEMSFFYF